MSSIEVHYKNNFAAIKIAHYIAEYLNNNSAIVCIGTDKCIIDSLGPLIGTMLSKEKNSVDIYGTLNEPIHAINLQESIDKIRNKNYDNIIAIDACLSNTKKQGVLEIRKGAIKPGQGIGKKLPNIGNISIIGIVDSKDKDFEELLHETRLSLVYNMADVISQGISMGIHMNRLMNDEDKYCFYKENEIT